MRGAVLAALAATACNDVCDGPACEAFAAPCPPGAEAHLRLEYRDTIETATDANPEIVAFVPGVPGRAIVASAAANRIVAVQADEDGLDAVRSVPIDTGSNAAVLSSVAVSPSGELGAITVSHGSELCAGCVCVPDAPTGCACGFVRFVDLRDDAFGSVIATVQVGYTPDSGAFSADGRYFVTADEDERDNRECKPVDRHGGSVSIIDVAAAELVQQIAVADEDLDEPEGIAISPDGIVAVAIQETDKLAFFDLDDVPDAELEIVELAGDGSAEAFGPDGMAISPDGGRLAVSLEAADAYLVVDLATRALLDQRAVDDDLPEDYYRNEDMATRQLEPEQVTFVASQDAAFLVGTLQETGVAVAYRLEEDGTLTFDSVQPAGRGGGAGPTVGPEGVATGQLEAGGRTLVLTANELEGSVTLLRSVCPR